MKERKRVPHLTKINRNLHPVMVDTAFDANLSTEKSCKSWISKGPVGPSGGKSQRWS